MTVIALSLALGVTAAWAGGGKASDTPWILMSGARALPVSAESAQGLATAAAGNLRPLSLAAGDFNGDGASDLLAGYAAGRGGLVAFQAGDPAGIGPEALTARRGWPAGKLPFKDSVTQIPTEELPDWILVGDFDADSRLDFAVAARGGRHIEVHLGDGAGGFAPPTFVELPGDLTALACGEVNRRDGLADWVAGVVGPKGPEVLVFESPEGAMRAEPERFAFDAAVSALAIGQFSDGPFTDIAAATGTKIAVIWGRDRFLTRTEKIRKEAPRALVTGVSLPVETLDLAVGNFHWDPMHHVALAALGSDGRIRFLSPAPAGSPASAAASSFGPWQNHPDIELPEKASHLRSARSTSLPVDGLLALPQDATAPLRFIAGDVEDRTDDLAEAHRPPRSKTLSPQEINAGLTVAAALPMHLNEDALEDWILLGTDKSGASVTTAMTSQPEATWIVDSPWDDGGSGTLRQAILNANALGGLQAIHFNIPMCPGCTGAPVIDLNMGALPTITCAVSLQGGSQPVAGQVGINGGGDMSIGGNGLEVSGGNSGIGGIIVQNMRSNGIVLETNGGDTVAGCWVGTDSTGSHASPCQSHGVQVTSTSPGDTVGSTLYPNIISGNKWDGVAVGAGSSVIEGNLIGLGNGATLPNGHWGVEVYNGANAQIGGTSSSARNIFSGSSYGSVSLAGGSGALVQGNWIGVDVAPELAAPGGYTGVQIAADTTTVGGTSSGARNVISSCSTYGVNAQSGTSVLIEGNYVGLAPDGATPFSNAIGIRVGNCPSPTIGGSAAGAGNVISGNTDYGIQVAAGSYVTISGNIVGLDSSGTASVGTNTAVGIDVGSASYTMIGGYGASERNVISGNGTGGIRAESGSMTTWIDLDYVGTDMTGTSAIANGYGVYCDGGSSLQIYGCLISGNTHDGIDLYGSPAGPPQVGGSTIGLNLAGTAALANGGSGVFLSGAYSAIMVGNVISGNTGRGIYMVGDSGQNAIRGDRIGTNAAGTAKIPNGSYGIEIDASGGGSLTMGYNTIGGTSSSDANLISGHSSAQIFILGNSANGNNSIYGNTIGTNLAGSAGLGGGMGIVVQNSVNDQIGEAGSGNLISGNGMIGIEVKSGSGTIIQANKIGVDAAGTTALANGTDGIFLWGASSCQVGGSGSGQGNVISGNASSGIYVLAGGGSSPHQIKGNIIGLDATGAHALPNGSHGIDISGSNSNAIGGTAAGAGNVISANAGDGVRLESSSTGNTLYDNKIGTDAAGALILGNSGSGVKVVGTGALNNIIGQPSYGNVIANNSGPGVWISSGTGNSIRGNSLYNNGGGSASVLGIQLGSGLYANTHCGGASGPNNLQNYPVITSVTPSGSGSLISGTLDSASLFTYTVDLYSNQTAHSSGYGEGRTWLGSVSAIPNLTCASAWSFTTSTPATNVSATATDPNGNTSEFSLTFAPGIPTEAGPPSSTPLKATKGSGTAVSITYGAACNATEYAAYWGTSPISGSLSWQSSNCGVTNAFDPGAVSPGRFVYFVVVGEGASYEGSYGKNSAGSERPPMSAGCHPQDLAGSCP